MARVLGQGPRVLGLFPMLRMQRITLHLVITKYIRADG